MNRRVRIMKPAVVRSRVRRGAALIDVIIGGLLLGVGLAAIISLASRSLRTQLDGERQLVATWIADELLTMVLVEGPVNYRKQYDTSGQCGYPFEEFSYDITLEDLGLTEPFRVTATVRWPSGLGERQIQVQTFIAERGGEPDSELRAPAEYVDREKRWHPPEDM